MGHMYGYGLNTAAKGLTVDAVRVTGLNVAPGSLCTIAEDCKSGLIASVTHSSTGVYVFQLTSPFPPKVVDIIPKISAALVTSPVLIPRYQSGSYNATTGQFVVMLSTTAAAASAGAATDELHVDMKFNRYTR